jgi:phosphoserine phosphatase
MANADLYAAADVFFQQNMLGTIFPVMQTLLQQLRVDGCEIWAVSSSNQWVVQIGAKHFGIPPERTLSAEVFIENGRATNRLVRVPSGPGKPQAIQEVVGRVPDAAFGNSKWDTDMLAMAKAGFAVNPSLELKEAARKNGWNVYFPEVG